MTDETTLLPCPFCSSEPDLLESYGGWYIRCSCGVSMCENYSEGGFPIGEFITETEAIAAWNTRAELGSECDKWKAKAEEAGRAMNAAAGLWAKADAENRELRKMLDELNAKLGSKTCKLIDTTSPANDDYWHSAMCDKCGAEFTCAIFGRDSKLPDANHCPNCGAKVVEQYKEDDNENN